MQDVPEDRGQDREVKIVGVTELRDNLREIVSFLQSAESEDIVVLQKSRPRFVLMNYEKWRELIDGEAT